MKNNITIRIMTDSDSETVLEIYRMGIETRNATFETVVPGWDVWDANHHKHSRFIVEKDNKIVGWVALSPVSGRDAYKGVAEISIYVDTNYPGRGIGSKLMENVIKSSEENGIWTLYTSLFPENRASVDLHKKFGFRIVGTREKIGCLDGIWRDTLIMERRSRETAWEEHEIN
jgi:phosphinothricin acetyltransferase